MGVRLLRSGFVKGSDRPSTDGPVSTLPSNLGFFQVSDGRLCAPGLGLDGGRPGQEGGRTGLEKRDRGSVTPSLFSPTGRQVNWEGGKEEVPGLGAETGSVRVRGAGFEDEGRRCPIICRRDGRVGGTCY